jgi:hypothetical protein
VRRQNNLRCVKNWLDDLGAGRKEIKTNSQEFAAAEKAWKERQKYRNNGIVQTNSLWEAINEKEFLNNSAGFHLIAWNVDLAEEDHEWGGIEFGDAYLTERFLFVLDRKLGVRDCIASFDNQKERLKWEGIYEVVDVYEKDDGTYRTIIKEANSFYGIKLTRNDTEYIRIFIKSHKSYNKHNWFELDMKDPDHPILC